MKCAFCHNEAASGEHIWDNWINEELPKTRFNSKKRMSIGSKTHEFVSVGLNEKMRVVCEKCNNGWMSDLTAKVKQRFSRSILKGEPFSLSEEDAKLLASFSLMKAMIKDFCYDDAPFFTRAARKRLKQSLVIPPLARMWFAFHQGSARYSFRSISYRADTKMAGPLHGMEFFCYTYIVGNLTLQLLMPKWRDVGDWNKPLAVLAPNSYWLPAAPQFWPYTGEVNWPPEKYLGDSTIEQFVYRFNAPVNIPVKIPIL